MLYLLQPWYELAGNMSQVVKDMYMAQYTLPTFNVQVDIWFPGDTPAGGGPDANALAQVYVEPHIPIGVQVGVPGTYVPAVVFRMQKEVLFGSPNLTTTIFGVGLFDGTFRYYIVRWWDYEHQGFPNQYLMMICEQCNADGTTPDASR